MIKWIVESFNTPGCQMTALQQIPVAVAIFGIAAIFIFVLLWAETKL